MGTERGDTVCVNIRGTIPVDFGSLCEEGHDDIIDPDNYPRMAQALLDEMAPTIVIQKVQVIKCHHKGATADMSVLLKLNGPNKDKLKKLLLDQKE